MGFFNKLFGEKNREDNSQANSVIGDNKILIRLLDTWGREESEHSFKAVLHELFDGNSYLLLPTKNNAEEKIGMLKTLKECLNSELTSITEDDGIKILNVFSDETALGKWTDELNSYYIAVATQDIFSLCRQLEIDRIIINNGQRNMFTLHRKNDDDNETPDDQEQIKIGIPTTPLNEKIIEKLNIGFSQLNTVKKAYQYIQEKQTEENAPELVLMIGVLMDTDDDESRSEMINALKESLKGENRPNIPLGATVVDDDWGKVIEEIGIIPFYKKQEI
ncbi:MAG: SseB family protein [Dysgonomonas sp.]